MKKLIICTAIILASNLTYAENWQKVADVQGEEYYFLADAVKNIDQYKVETKFKRRNQTGEVISAVRINCATKSMLTTQVVVKDYTTGKEHILNSDTNGQAGTTYYKVPTGTVQAAAVNRICH